MSTPFAAPNTDRTTVLAIALRDLIRENAYSLDPLYENIQLQPENVRYGNHLMVPASPSVILRPGRKVRTLRGVAGPGGRTENDLNVLVDVMAADVLPGEEAARLAIDQFAENVERLFYVDPTIGGLVIHGFVTLADPGEIFINNTQWRTVRMTYTAKTITYLSPPAAPI